MRGKEVSNMSDIALLNCIRKNAQLRREHEGPSGLEGPSPRGGWDVIRDASYENQIKRDGLVIRVGEKVCVRCHTVKSVSGTCFC